jgi:hypothetical protein
MPRATVETLREAQDRQTIRMALSNGASATPIGAITHLRLPGQDRAQQFPTALVDDVLQGMARNATQEGAEGCPGAAPHEG